MTGETLHQDGKYWMPIDDVISSIDGYNKRNNLLERQNKKLRAALQKAVDDYGKPGGPWSVPSDPGTWIIMAKDALGGK